MIVISVEQFTTKLKRTRSIFFSVVQHIIEIVYISLHFGFSDEACLMRSDVGFMRFDHKNSMKFTHHLDSSMSFGGKLLNNYA